MKNGLLIFVVINFVSTSLFGQYDKGKIIHETILSTSIQDNLGGEDALRHIALYLPSGYDNSLKKYPVIYWAHGFGRTPADSIFYEMDNWQNLIDKAIARKVIEPIIMVFVDNTTLFWGSNYANSNLTGKWEDLMSIEIVQHIDNRYRTIKSNKSRGIAGFSMGGYGSLRLAMRNPNVFNAVYALSPAMGALTHSFSLENRRSFKLAAKANSREELLPDFMARAFIAYGRTFTPNFEKPPFYCDLPVTFEMDEIVFHDDVLEIWHNNTLVELIENNISGLRKLKAIKFDWGMYDIPYITASCRTLTNKLGSYGINHYAEEFKGGHRIPKFKDDGPYLTEMLPFFAENLLFE
jgi:enterochelin esterase-like enzyme